MIELLKIISLICMTDPCRIVDQGSWYMLDQYTYFPGRGYGHNRSLKVEKRTAEVTECPQPKKFVNRCKEEQ